MRIALLLAGIILHTTLWGQTPKLDKKLVEQEFFIQESIYKRSLALRDYIVATDALYNMQALKPERTDLADSLCLLYFGRALYHQSRTLAEEILERNPGNELFREVLAQSLEELGLYTEALPEYEKLYKTQQRLYVLYKIASMQFILKRYGECDQSLNRLISDPQGEKESISMSQDRQAGSRQQVLVAAAAYNIKGVILQELNRKEDALASFEKALEIQPDFRMAQANIDLLKNP